jgi:NADH dehydrogenase
MKNRILVLGGTSYLGAHLVYEIHQDYDVTATYLTRRPPVEVGNYRRCNLLSKGDISSFGNYDAVVLYSSVISGKNKLLQNNEMVRNAVSFCNSTGTLLIFISSSQVHFSKPSEYRQSKLSSEHHVANHCKRYYIVRPAAPYGAVLPFETTRVQPFHVLVNTIMKFPVVPIIGDGKYLRQPLHIKDLNKLIVRLFDYPVPNGIFEIGGPKRWLFRDIVGYLVDLADRRVTRLYIPIIACSLASRFTTFIDPELVRAVVSDEKVDNGTWQKYFSFDLISFNTGANDLFRKC